MHRPTSWTRIAHTAALVLTAATLAACAGMTQQEKNTAIGAGVGAIGGSVLTGGSAAGTIGGAAVGGVIGHEIDKTKK
jgi:osmotically inducible lipoprotein OsmB